MNFYTKSPGAIRRKTVLAVNYAAVKKALENNAHYLPFRSKYAYTIRELSCYIFLVKRRNYYHGFENWDYGW